MARRPLRNEKAKNFKGAIKRLFQELNSFKYLILFGLILAALVDKISEGLVINTKNLETIANHVNSNLSKEKMSKVIPEILDIDLSKENVLGIMAANDIKNADKQEFQKFMESLETSDETKLLNDLNLFPRQLLRFYFLI